MTDERITAVRQLSERVIDLATELELISESSRLRDQLLRMRGGRVECVVVGGRSQGKTAVFRSLTGLPVTPGARTTLFVSAERASADSVTTHDSAGATTTVAPEGLEALLSDPPLDVRAVRIGTTMARLPMGLRIMDTPGLSGSRHDDSGLMLAASRRADLVLFVTDASAPLSLSECEFIVEAQARAPAVAVLLTKIDAYRGWRDVLRASSGRLADLGVGSVVPIISHSSRLRGVAARESIDPDVARTMMDRSGDAALTSLLHAVSANHRANRLELLSASCLSAAQACVETAQRRAEARHQNDLEAQQDDLRDRAKHLKEISGSYRNKLDVHLRRLGALVTTRTDKEVREFGTVADRLASDGVEPEEIIERINQRVEAYLAELTATVSEELAATATAILEPFGPAVPTDTIGFPAGFAADGVEMSSRDEQVAVGAKLVQNYSLILFAGLPSTLGAWLATLGVAGSAALAGPLGLVLGAGTAFGAYRSRQAQSQMVKHRQQLNEAMRVASVSVRTAVSQQWGVDAAEFRHQMFEAVAQIIADRRGDLEAEARVIEEVRRESAGAEKDRRARYLRLAASASSFVDEATALTVVRAEGRP